MNTNFEGIPADICNLQQGIKNMGNSERLFKKHFEKFRGNSNDLAERLRTMLSEHKYEEAAVLCHSIKGLSGMLGLSSVHKHTMEAETILKDNLSPSADQLDEFRGLIGMIERDIDDISKINICI